jgi:hypothetical protein
MDAATFFNRLAVTMQDNPPYAADDRALWKLGRIGVVPGQPFEIAKVDPAVVRGLNRAVRDALIKINDGVTTMANVNGWIQPPDLGRYRTDYGTRAGIAMAGLGADLQEDTIYPMAFSDADGNRLNSANRYIMHYDRGTFTPTNATWSVSLYQGPNYVLNAINRYDIAPWMPLAYNQDGSLDIYIQADSPGKDKEPNWLPAPRPGDLNIVIRNYWPKPEALDGTYKNPTIRRVG